MPGWPPRPECDDQTTCRNDARKMPCNDPKPDSSNSDRADTGRCGWYHPIPSRAPTVLPPVNQQPKVASISIEEHGLDDMADEARTLDSEGPPPRIWFMHCVRLRSDPNRRHGASRVEANVLVPNETKDKCTKSRFGESPSTFTVG